MWIRALQKTVYKISLTLAKWLDTAIRATFKSVDFEHDPGEADTATLCLILCLLVAIINAIRLIGRSPPRRTHFAIGLAIETVVDVMGRIVWSDDFAQLLHIGLVALARGRFARALVVAAHDSIGAVRHAIGRGSVAHQIRMIDFQASVRSKTSSVKLLNQI